LIFSKSMESLLSPICLRCLVYFVGLFVFFDEFFEVRARVANLLLASIEDDLPEDIHTTFWDAMMFEFYF